MLFEEYLNVIISEMKIKNSDISEFSNIHQSTISRLRHADRLPPIAFDQIENLLNSIFRLCLKNGTEENLKNILYQQLHQQQTACFSPDHQEILKTLQYEIGKEKITTIALSDIFYKTAKLFIAEDYITQKSNQAKYLYDFPKKLDYFMRVFNITNAELGNVIKIDNSLISRWRHGVRLPKEDNPAVEGIANYFARVIALLEQEKINNLQESFLSLLDSFSGQNTEEKLLTWFHNTENQQPLLKQRMNCLVAEINKYLEHKSAADIIDLNYLEELLSANKQQVYHHIRGLQQAIVRFLSEIIVSSEKHTLLLFSNQDMAWMTDPSFLKIWELLMYTLLCQGHKIEIIHTFGRSRKEISIALEKWLPLYLKGDITPYTCDRLNIYDKNQSPLIKTLFIDLGHAAVNAELIQGNEENSEYFYYTSSSKIQDCTKQFVQLKEMSEPIFPILFEEKSFVTELFTNLEQHAKDPEAQKKLAISKRNLQLLKEKVQNNLYKKDLPKI